MKTPQIRNGLVLLSIGLVSGLGMTYQWQNQPPPASASGPADVLGGWLKLMPDQIKQIKSIDPEFAAERDSLENKLAKEREQLAVLFEQAGVEDEKILEQVESVIAAHDALERRVARYLLAIRPELTAAQRARLFERCATGVREAGGRRWRGGRAGDDETIRGGGGPPPDRGRGAGRGYGGPNRAPRPGGPASRPASQPKGDQP